MSQSKSYDIFPQYKYKNKLSVKKESSFGMPVSKNHIHKPAILLSSIMKSSAVMRIASATFVLMLVAAVAVICHRNAGNGVDVFGSKAIDSGFNVG